MLRPSSPLSNFNSAYLVSLEDDYVRDPASIEPAWRLIFDALHDLNPVESGWRATRAPFQADGYRQRGYLAATLDPLAPKRIDSHPEQPISTRDAESRWQDRYAGTLCVETAHIDSAELRHWIHDRIERGHERLGAPARRRALQRLIEAEEFERFLGLRFPGKKKFGIEGLQSLIALLDSLLRQACAQGVTDVVIGTMHRGRLNLMANVLQYPLPELLAHFKGVHPFPSDPDGPADVPYHLGHSARLEFDEGALEVSLTPNPSHLEAVNALVLGRARARQDLSKGARSVLPIILHTDASVIAQGSVSETLQLASLAGYSTGGTVHIIVNNQIGFTTEAHEARTSRHCTGGWKAIDGLILHVNSDDMDAVLRSGHLALEFRQTHAADAVIDLVGLRRYGHNEFDEPRFTQPLRYLLIDAHPPLSRSYAEKLQSEGQLAVGEDTQIAKAYKQRLGEAYANAGETKSSMLDSIHAVLEPPGCILSLRELQRIGEVLTQPPAGFEMHSVLRRVLHDQRAALPDRLGWAVAEALAFGSLLAQGISVRLSGQDTRRGAFSQRHLAWIDQKTGKPWIPLESVARGSASFEVLNSPLSEYAVLGFEYGYSLDRQSMLVLWEAQFGDFANGAQIVIDQFIAAGRAKWKQESAIVLLLPHGLEGQGPEHSSARIERFLQLCAEDNLLVAHPSTPSNYFHLLRQQALAVKRRPLVVFSAKALLRHAHAVSSLSELASGHFERVRVLTSEGRPRRVVLCSGKFGWEIAAACTEDAAIVFLEQLYPFPTEELVAVLQRWPAATYVWSQEEPLNMGAWSHVNEPLQALARRAGIERVECVSRPASASPAGGFHARHDADQRELVRRSLGLGPSVELGTKANAG